MDEDEPLRRGPGRPRLKAGERSVNLTLRLPTSTHAHADRLARAHHTTMSELFRKAFRLATRRRDERTDD